MSYALAVDEPSVASYVTRRGPQFREEFNALLVAYVQTRMSYEQTTMQERKPCSGPDLFRCLRETAPLLDEDEVRLFDRVKDYGRAMFETFSSKVCKSLIPSANDLAEIGLPPDARKRGA